MRTLQAGVLVAVTWFLTAEAVRGDEPRNLTEALARLESVLGKADPDSQLEWRVPTETEFRSRPKPDEAEVLQIFKGVKIIGHPFVEGESISFDEIWQWERTVYDLSDAGSKTLTRSQVSHNVTRFSISLNSGVWLVHGTMLTNGVQSMIGKSAFQGVLKWNNDGFEIIGASAVGRYYAAGGKYVLGASYGSTSYARDGEQLLIKSKQQPYLLATDPAGVQTQFPDFTKPFGSLYEAEFKSDPRKVPR